MCSSYCPQNTQTTQVVSSVDGISFPWPYTALMKVYLYLRSYAVPWSPEDVLHSDSDPHSPMAEYSETEGPVESYTHIPRVFDVVYSGCKDTADCTNFPKHLALTPVV